MRNRLPPPEPEPEGDEARRGRDVAEHRGFHEFTLEDMRVQFAAIMRLGGLRAVLERLPGGRPAGGSLHGWLIPDAQPMAQYIAVIESMTPTERQGLAPIEGTRLGRVAAGAGVAIARVREVLRVHKAMVDQMRDHKGGDGPGPAPVPA